MFGRDPVSESVSDPDQVEPTEPELRELNDDSSTESRVRTLLTQLNRRVDTAAPSPGAQWVDNLGSWFPRMTRLSTPASEMLASRITPPLEPSLSMARDRAEGRTDTQIKQSHREGTPAPSMPCSSSVYLQRRVPYTRLCSDPVCSWSP